MVFESNIPIKRQVPYLDILNRKTNSWEFKEWNSPHLHTYTKTKTYNSYKKMIDLNAFTIHTLFYWKE